MNPTLAALLMRLGLEPGSPPTDPQAWTDLLRHVSTTYGAAEQRSRLLERTLETQIAQSHHQTSRLEAVVDSLADGMCTMDLEGRVDFANNAAARILNDADLVGSTVLHRFQFHPETAYSEVTARHILDIVGSGKTYRDETALLWSGDGSAIQTSCVLSPIHNGSGITGAVLLFRDLTEHQEALDRVERTEHHYRSLFGAIPIAVFEEDFSMAGKWLARLRAAGVVNLREYLADHHDELLDAIRLIQVREVNPAAMALLEAETADQLSGPLNPSVFTEETLESVVAQLEAIWDGRDSVNLELTGTTLKGNRLDAIFSWHVSRVRGRQDLTRVLVAITDITKRKEVENQMANLVKSKDEFIASVSHEIRTPLTGVHGSAMVLSQDWDRLTDEERSELIGYVATESGELARIVEDLLVAARADVGSLTVRIQPIDLTAEIKTTLDGISFRNGRPDTSGVVGSARADPLRFRQILRNLVTNAVRYGGDRVSIQTEQAGGRVLVSVVDDGPGIPEHLWEMVFEPYQRAHTDNSTPGSVGLGLTVARQLALLMDGDLSYRRSEGLSRFELLLEAV